MSAVLLIVCCLLLGVLAKSFRLLSSDAAKGFSFFVVWVAIPATALSVFPKIQLSFALLSMGASAWLAFLAGLAFSSLFLFFWKGSMGQKACVLLLSGLCNSSFVGFPILDVVYKGNAAFFPYAAAFDQLGSFLLLALVGVPLVRYFSMNKEGMAQRSFSWAALFLYPPFLSVCLGMLLSFFELRLPEAADEMLLRLSQTLIPLALFSVGFQLKWRFPRQHFLPLSWILCCKLLLVPAFVFFCCQLFFAKSDLPLQVSVLESAMPSMISASLLLQEANLDEDLASMAVSLGLLLCPLSLYLWTFLLF